MWTPLTSRYTHATTLIQWQMRTLYEWRVPTAGNSTPERRLPAQRIAALDDSDQDRDDRDDQKDVDQPAQRIGRDQAEEPESKDDDDEGLEHELACAHGAARVYVVVNIVAPCFPPTVAERSTTHVHIHRRSSRLPLHSRIAR